MDEQRRKQAIYARLSSQDKKSDLDAQVNGECIKEWGARCRYQLKAELQEIA